MRQLGFVMIVCGVLAVLSGVVTFLFLMFPGIFGLTVYEIRTPSMLPGIPIGGAAYVASAQTGVATGDIVVYQDDAGREILHRIIGEDLDGGFILKGDANKLPDPEPVARDMISGRMILSVRDMNLVNDFLSFACVALFCMGLSLLLAGWSLRISDLKQKG